jgi:hypothetical protein
MVCGHACLNTADPVDDGAAALCIRGAAEQVTHVALLPQAAIE